MKHNNQQMEKRLDQLRQEFASGQNQLAELDQKRANLRDTLLRISGAIQVLEETLGEGEGEGEGAGEDTIPSDGGEAATT
jgi:septal ring factor EnvC (AmiA/AmiB activator)